MLAWFSYQFDSDHRILTFEEGRHLSELRDAVLAIATFPLQLLQALQELSAGQARVDIMQGAIHLSPVRKQSM